MKVNLTLLPPAPSLSSPLFSPWMIWDSSERTDMQTAANTAVTNLESCAEGVFGESVGDPTARFPRDIESNMRPWLTEEHRDGWVGGSRNKLDY